MEGEREVNSNLIGLKELGKINCCILILFPGLHLRSYTLGTKLTPTQLAILEAWKQSLTSGLDAKVLAGSQKLSFSFLFLRLRTHTTAAGRDQTDSSHLLVCEKEVIIRPIREPHLATRQNLNLVIYCQL